MLYSNNLVKYISLSKIIQMSDEQKKAQEDAAKQKAQQDSTRLEEIRKQAEQDRSIGTFTKHKPNSEKGSQNNK